MFFVRSYCLYGFCVRFCFVFLCIYVSPRLPSSGNRRVYVVCFNLYSFVIYCFLFGCCVICYSQSFYFLCEGGGFVDLPCIKLYVRVPIA
uniref:Ribosomal protein S12 n=1 Tax=Phytomonas serpens TaxID=5707 RepID=O47756_9TRYP|nr:ribosomal protein S12 [Phytomonas serpens]